MTEPAELFEEAYRSALIDYLALGDESGRVAAYELGRQAVSEGIGLLELAAMHRQVEAEWLTRPSENLKADHAESTQFFIEALSTFDMAQRGFWEAQERAAADRNHARQLQELNEAVVAITACPEYGRRLIETAERARALVGADEAAIVPRDPRQSTLVAGTAAVPASLQERLWTTRGGPAVIRGAPSEPVPWLAVPLPLSSADGQGSIIVWGGPAEFGPTQEGLLTQLATFAAVSLDMSWRLEREHEAAVTLQESLLPVGLPAIDGLAVACRYLPATRGSEVGGDWYDVFNTDNGDTILVVGDVTGHDLRAAALMGQLRLALQAYAIDGHAPTEVLDRVDRLLQRLDDQRLATVVYVVLDRDGRRLRIVNAGHPPPLLVLPDGTATFLASGLSVPLGVDEAGLRHREATMMLPPGSRLLLYSDGLVEDRALAMQDGLASLLAAARNFAGSPEELCDRILATVQGERSDDICVLAVAVGSDG